MRLERPLAGGLWGRACVRPERGFRSGPRPLHRVRSPGPGTPMRRSSIFRRAWRPPFRCRLRVRSEGLRSVAGSAWRSGLSAARSVRSWAGQPAESSGPPPRRSCPNSARCGRSRWPRAREGKRPTSFRMPQLQRRSNLAMTPWIRGSEQWPQRRRGGSPWRVR